MNPVLFIALAAAGGVGAVLRWIIEVFIQARTRSAFPWAIFGINVGGSFALGIVTGLLGGIDATAQFVGAGLLGGFTTFSSVATATALMLEERAFRSALINTIGTFIAVALAAILGLWLARLG